MLKKINAARHDEVPAQIKCWNRAGGKVFKGLERRRAAEGKGPRAMNVPIPFTFGIPLLPRAYARHWPRIEALLDLTLTSVLAQTDQDFRIIIAGHDRPQALPADPRLTFLKADWPAEAIRSDNRDRGRKTHAINRLVLEHGGGLLMFLDADDWVDVHLVETARSLIAPDQVGGLIEAGFAADFQTLRAAPLPDPRVFVGEFHRVCGSSAVWQLRSDAPDPLRGDPYRVLHEHHRLVEAAGAYGVELVRLPVSGCYVINTSDNHSELHGPYAPWRRAFTEGVNRVGLPIDAAFATRFGLGMDQLHAASQQFCPSARSLKG
jgi:hypothetical protein